MADYLPEDVIVRILERLPIKSLSRFTCVSKRWRFIILCDPEFAKAQFQIASHHQTLRHRLLISTSDSDTEFNSLDLNAPPPPPPRNVRCPLTQPGCHNPVRLLCSCNGLVLAILCNQENDMYIWNPSTQFFKKLPDPADLPSKTCPPCYGFGYLSATDDYKVIASFKVSVADDEMEEMASKEMHIFSSKANTWKRTDAPLDFDFDFYSDSDFVGTLSNEALHWLDDEDDGPGIFAFDLAKEEFQRMPLPIVLDGEVSYLMAFGDSLCVLDFENLVTASSIDLWVMQKYGVADSWTKLFNFKFSNQLGEIYYCLPVSVMETSTFLHKVTRFRDGNFIDLIRIGHTKQKPEMHLLSRNTDLMEMIEYEETLLWLAAP